MSAELSRRGFLERGGLAAGSLLWAGGLALGRQDSASPAEVRGFLAAVKAGDLGTVKAALAKRPSLSSARDEADNTAFVLAHWHGHTEVAALLRQNGLELDFLEAALAEDWPRCEALAAADPALVDSVWPIGGTSLFVMASLGRPQMWRLQSLGADPNLVPVGSKSAVFGAVSCQDLERAAIAATDLLGNAGRADVVLPGGETVLHAAVRRSSAKLVRLVLRKGGDATAKDALGETPLALARRLGFDEVAAILEHRESVPIDYRESRFYDAGGSPMELPDITDLPAKKRAEIVGVSHGRMPRVKELLAEDSRYAFSISTADEMAIEAGAHMGNRPIVELHLDHGAPLSLPTAITLGDLEATRRMLEEDPALVDERGAHDFALMWYPAIGGGSVAAAEILVEHGADIDQESYGTTALHWAAMRGQTELVEFLLDEGADPSAVGRKFDPAGQTPLQLAQARGQGAMVGLLKSRGG